MFLKGPNVILKMEKEKKRPTVNNPWAIRNKLLLTTIQILPLFCHSTNCSKILPHLVHFIFGHFLIIFRASNYYFLPY